MKVGEILANSVVSLSGSFDINLGKDYAELEAMTKEELLDYTKNLSFNYVDLVYQLNEIKRYIEFCRKYKETK